MEEDYTELQRRQREFTEFVKELNVAVLGRVVH